MGALRSTKQGLIAAWQRLEDLWLDRPWIDWLAACVVAGSHAAIVELAKHGDLLSWPQRIQRISGYAAVAGAVSLIAGLTTMAISHFAGAQGDRIVWLRAGQAKLLRRNWLSALRTPLLVALISITMIFIDTKDKPSAARFVFEGAVVLAVIRFSRMTFIFRQFLEIDAADQIEGTKTQGQSNADDILNTGWTRS
jgi:hypothetical protein